MSDADLASRIQAFLDSDPIGVVGASRNPSKYGHRVLADLLASGRRAIPVNPKETEILDVAVVATVEDLPEGTRALSVITPPAITESIIASAIARKIERVWIQPGAESDAAMTAARDAGIDVIAGGPCVLVALAEER